jgi:hypothetical protein
MLSRERDRKCNTIFSNGVAHSSLCVIAKRIQKLLTSQGNIFITLQHFKTKLCNFTEFKFLILLSSCGDGFSPFQSFLNFSYS